MKKKFFKFSVISIAIIVIAIAFLFSLKLFPDGGEKKKIYKGLSLIARSLALVDKKYVDKVSPNRVTDGALREMAGSVSSFSVYLKKSEAEKFFGNSVLSYAGFKVEEAYGFPVVGAVIRSDLKEKLKEGDLIKRINNVSTYNISYLNILLMLMGDDGEELELKLLRGDEKKPFKVKVRLKKEPFYEISKNGKNIYLKLFFIPHESVLERLRKSLRDFRGKRLILDLRKVFFIKNELVKDLANFLSIKKTVVDFMGKKSTKKIVLEGSAFFKSIDVLIDRGTVYSEALLSFLLKRAGARLVGYKTYPQVGISCGYRFSDGAVLYTVCYARSQIWKSGVKPDVKLKSKKAFKEFLSKAGFFR